jgi:hypothetical protein
LVRAPSPYAEVEARASSLLAFTDETALVTVLGYGVYLAASSVLLAIWAEVKREENLYLSAGFMCGSGGLFLASKAVGTIVIVLGAITLLSVRHARRA